MDIGTTVAGGGVTAAIVATIYGIHRLMQRSQCASHTKCCDIKIARVQEELDRTKTERDDAQAMLASLVRELRGDPSEREGEVEGKQKEESVSEPVIISQA